MFQTRMFQGRVFQLVMFQPTTSRRRISKSAIPKSKKMASVKKIIRAGLLALLAVICAGSIGLLRAQEQPATPQKQQQSDEAGKQRSLQQQLVHEEREAAGEEKDEKAEFKHSPSVRFIARHTGLSAGSAYLLSDLLNFAVVAGLIFWACRKYLPAVFSARTAAIQKAMQEAQKASEEARRRLAEIESRLMKLDVEIGTMRDTAEKDAGAEEARIQAAAQEDARKMVESAQQEIAAAAKSARRELTAYAADLAVGLARKQIRVEAATDQALVRRFAGDLGASEASGPGKDGR
jgi:F-type H+-transporting ATPase subunit b